MKKKTPRIKHPGNVLPKRLLRPFLLNSAYSIDDNHYVFVAGGDKRNILETEMKFMYAVAAGGGVFWAAFHFREPIALVAALIALAIALTMHYFVKRMKPTQFVVFDREVGIVRYPRFLTRNGALEAPWQEWGARLWVMSSSTGIPNHVLSLVHLPSYKSWMIDVSVTGIDTLLGYWSFLVQYMDKNAPLPDVPSLSQYSNRTQGLGSWEEWEKSGIGFTQFDPYNQWLAELKDAPELDVMNREIERNRGW